MKKEDAGAEGCCPERQMEMSFWKMRDDLGPQASCSDSHRYSFTILL